MTSNAELHTLYYYADWLSENYNVVVVGSAIANYSSHCCQKNNIIVQQAFFNYKNFPSPLRKTLHIPIAILETILFCLLHRVDCLLSLGGVFYNGLAISLCSRLFE